MENKLSLQLKIAAYGVVAMSLLTVQPLFAQDSVDISELRRQFQRAQQEQSDRAKDATLTPAADNEAELLAAEEALLEELQGATDSGHAALDTFDLEQELAQEEAALAQEDPGAVINTSNLGKNSLQNDSFVSNAEVTTLKSENTSLKIKYKEQAKKLDAAQKEKSEMSNRVQAAEREAADLRKSLQKAQSRLLVAETAVERLSRIIEERNEKTLSRYASKDEKMKARTRFERKRLEPTVTRKISKFEDELPIATVTVAKANLRIGPGQNNSPLMTVARGTRLVVETRRGDWYRVVAPSGARAWVSSDVVAFGKDFDSGPSRTIKIQGFKTSVEDEALELVNSSY